LKRSGRHAGDKKVYESTALFLVEDIDQGSHAIAGVAFDADYLKDHFFPEMLDAVVTRNVSENHAVMMLRGKYDSRSPGGIQWMGWRHPEVERNLEGAFSGLTLAIKLKGTTLAAIGTRFARIRLYPWLRSLSCGHMRRYQGHRQLSAQ